MFKRYSYQGGVCDPLVIHWPAGFAAKGEVREQYHHCTDIVPTILDCCGVEMPEVMNGGGGEGLGHATRAGEQALSEPPLVAPDRPRGHRQHAPAGPASEGVLYPCADRRLLFLARDEERAEHGRLGACLDLVVVRPAAGTRMVPVAAELDRHGGADARGVDAVLQCDRRGDDVGGGGHGAQVNQELPVPAGPCGTGRGQHADRQRLPLDKHGRVPVDETLRVIGSPRIWALGDCAAVPNEATPGETDPATCQHALRQARRLARNLRDTPRAYSYRTRGQMLTLGSRHGIALVGGLRVKGVLGWLIARGYHVLQLPFAARRARVLADWTAATLFRRDVAELSSSTAVKE